MSAEDKTASKRQRRERPTFVDLFSGCGGFSLGLRNAGLECLAAIDNNADAIETHTKNLSGGAALVRDLTSFSPAELGSIIGTDSVDVIVGGPPCQGFSKVRMVNGANYGPRLVDDPRRSLYRNYLEFVAHFRPSVFVMENVPGIRSAAGGEFFAAIQSEARALGYRAHGARMCAWRYGVPQKRERDFIIGTRRGLGFPRFSGHPVNV